MASPPKLLSMCRGTHRNNPWFATARGLLISLLMAAPLAFGAVEARVWAPLTIGVIVTGVIWAVACVKAGRLDLEWSPLYIPALLLLLVACIQRRLGATFDPIATRDWCIKFALCFGVFFLVTQLFGRAQQARWLRFGIVCAFYAFILSTFAIIQFFSAPDLIYGVVQARSDSWVFGPYPNHNHYAGLLEMLVPLLIGTALALPRGHVLRVFVVFSALVGTVSVLLSGSRAGALSLAGEFAVFMFVFGYVHRDHHQERIRLLLMTLLLIGAAGLLAIALDVDQVSSHWQQLAKSPEVEMETRSTLARDALQMWRAHRVMGVGLGAFETAYTPFQSFATDLVVDHAHNDYAELLAESGVLGASLMVCALLLFCLPWWHRVRNLETQGKGWLRVGAGVGILGILIHSYFDFNLHIPANACWFAACIGLALAQSQDSHKP
jgi:O-antigen ligase